MVTTDELDKSESIDASDTVLKNFSVYERSRIGPEKDELWLHYSG